MSKKKITTIIILAILVLGLIGLYLWFSGFKQKIKDTASMKTLEQEFVDFYDSVNIKSNLNRDSMLVSFLDSMDVANDKKIEKLTGDKVTILVTGIDSRLGSTSKHADANHLITIWFESGIVDIISIPRGTKADAGYADSTADSIQNYLANVRSRLGRDKYVKNIKRISHIHKIDYYVEFGFSQAIGLLELLGFKENATQVLRVLRTRQVYGGQEHQRNYNQGQFIRQMILRFFPLIEGIEGELILRSALFLVETDLDIETVKTIVSRLKEKKFPKSQEDVILRVMPKYSHVYFNYDFTSQSSIDSLYNFMANKSLKLGARDREIKKFTTISDKIKADLNKLISDARPMLRKDPSETIRILTIPFQQRAWFQITDLKERAKLRREICELLRDAYDMKHDFKNSTRINNILEMEEKVFTKSVLRKK